MDDYLELKIDVFDVTGQRARVRKTITVGTLIDEILREFDDLDRRMPENYGVFLKGQGRLLDRDQTLEHLDIQNYDELEFKYARSRGRMKIKDAPPAILQEVSTGMEYPILWQPALIGRMDENPAHNELLVVDLSTHPSGKRISRSHAQLLVENGTYYLESLSANNPTYLNQELTPVIGRRQLTSGDTIRLGRNLVTLMFLIQA